MNQPLRKGEECYITCTSCGQTNKGWVPYREDRNIPEVIAPCPNCKTRAFVNSLGGLGAFMRSVAKDLAELKKK